MTKKNDQQQELKIMKKRFELGLLELFVKLSEKYYSVESKCN